MSCVGMYADYTVDDSFNIGSGKYPLTLDEIVDIKGNKSHIINTNDIMVNVITPRFLHNGQRSLRTVSYPLFEWNRIKTSDEHGRRNRLVFRTNTLQRVCPVGNAKSAR